MPLRLYNTLTRKTEPFTPADPSHVTFYTCGPTVYDDAHIGNFRSFLAADVLRRWIESPLCELDVGGPAVPAGAAAGSVHKGPRTVTHVMNITDVGHMTDDAEGGEAGEDRMAVAGKRLAEAKKSGKLPADAKIDPNDPYSIAAFYADRFLDDARKLGLKVALDAQKDPTLMPRATANVPGMIAVIKRLMDKGHAYVAGPAGSRAVYFRVKSFPNYGRLSGNTLDNLREGEGGRVNTANQSQKEHPADFLLWKEDASHIMSWPADFGGEAWGKGYPGWHIECTVMSSTRLDEEDFWKWTRERLVSWFRSRAEEFGLAVSGPENLERHFDLALRIFRDSPLDHIEPPEQYSDAVIAAAFVASRFLVGFEDRDIPQLSEVDEARMPSAPVSSRVWDRLKKHPYTDRIYPRIQTFLESKGTDGDPLRHVVWENGNPLIDVHSGGEDNIFPHHECEIAQSCCAFNAAPDQGSFSKMWFHPRFLLVEGTKMSKSKGNFYTARDLFARDFSPATVRFELIRTHYRANADFSLTRALKTGQQIEGWTEAIAVISLGLARQENQQDQPWDGGPASRRVLDQFTEAMSDDLNVAAAVAALYTFFGGQDSPADRADVAMGEMGRGPILEAVSRLPTAPADPGQALAWFERGMREGTVRAAWGAIHLMDAVLGVVFTPRKENVSSDIGLFIGLSPDPTVIAKLEARRTARAAKDFKASDAIRDELLKMGYTIKDAPGGKVEVRRA